MHLKSAKNHYLHYTIKRLFINIPSAINIENKNNNLIFHNLENRLVLSNSQPKNVSIATTENLDIVSKEIFLVFRQIPKSLVKFQTILLVLFDKLFCTFTVLNLV